MPLHPPHRCGYPSGIAMYVFVQITSLQRSPLTRLQNSLVFVSHTHGVWANPERKPSKRYGRLIQSPESDLSAMMVTHKPEVFSWISERTDEFSDEDEDEDEDEAGMEAPKFQEMRD